MCNGKTNDHENISFEWPKGIKRTKQREEIFKIMAKADKPLSVNDIYDELKKNADCKYCISTIYRSMTAFEESGIVSKTNLMGDDNAVFELNMGAHKHYAICLGCHKLVPLKECPFENVIINTDDSDFTITSHKLEIYGYCDKCKIK